MDRRRLPRNGKGLPSNGESATTCNPVGSMVDCCRRWSTVGRRRRRHPHACRGTVDRRHRHPHARRRRRRRFCSIPTLRCCGHFPRRRRRPSARRKALVATCRPSATLMNASLICPRIGKKRSKKGSSRCSMVSSASDPASDLSDPASDLAVPLPSLPLASHHQALPFTFVQASLLCSAPAPSLGSPRPARTKAQPRPAIARSSNRHSAAYARPEARAVAASAGARVLLHGASPSRCPRRERAPRASSGRPHKPPWADRMARAVRHRRGPLPPTRMPPRLGVH